MSTIQFTETVLRDANQSLIATRLGFSEFEPVLPDLDSCGFYSLECWGGATFDSCLRYLDEDPWERLRKIRKVCSRTPLQMLLRGQNLLGYRHYPDDVVRMFVRKSVENGISIVRIFDALNDIRNMTVSVDETLRCGAHASGCICYTLSPIHSIARYVALAAEIEALGCQSLCIKDMAGIMSPQEAYDLVTALRKKVRVPIVIHTHNTTGLGPMTLMKAVEAGADVIDTAISSFSGGSSQPPTETMAYALGQMGYGNTLDVARVKKVNDFFKPVRNACLREGRLNPIVMANAADALVYQVPGGMLSNLVAQLTAQNSLDRLDEVLEEVPRVRRELGYPPLVTPMSQIVGVQATANVLTGARYKTVSKEIRAYVRGEYGRAPAPIDPKVARLVLGDAEPVTGRFADTLKPGFEAARRELGGRARSDEDVLSYIAFPAQAEAYFDRRDRKEDNGVVAFSITRVQ